MVLDPMLALSLAAIIVQFVDFSSKLVSKGRQIHHATNGALPKNLDLEVVSSDLSQLTKRLSNHDKPSDSKDLSEEERPLKPMSQEYVKISDVLLCRLEKLKVSRDAKYRSWKSFRQALKSVWSKQEIDELSERLFVFRDQLQFHILASLKESNQILFIQQSERFDSLDTASKLLLEALLNNENIFTSKIDIQTTTITSLIQSEAQKTRAQIADALRACDVTAARPEPHNNGAFHNYSLYSTNTESKDTQTQDIVLRSLCFPTMADRYDGIDEAHAKTCSWIFQDSINEDQSWDNFGQWLKNPENIYWVCGKAGSGKSTLMRYISDDQRLSSLLQYWVGDSRDLVIATFFFCISGNPDQSSQVGFCGASFLSFSAPDDI